MLFSSPAFATFFAVYFLLHLAIPPRLRIYLIIAGSTVFYAWWRVEYVWVPFAVTAIATGGVHWMTLTDDERARKQRATLTIIALFLPLILFKYLDFIYREMVGGISASAGAIVGLPLPLGISFVTFTLTAYVVDIYQRRFPVAHRLSIMFGYVLFFPHLIAGPILRPNELIPQLENPRRVVWSNYRGAASIFALGLVKKLVFADQIAQIVNPIFAAGAPVDFGHAVLAIYGFAAQIYCDFSGYTDMAIGVALLLGVRLPINFRQPYAAASLGDFWRRWHITLSFWLRDYLYKPLGGSRRGLKSDVRNVMITMVLGGLWHGANWTFIVWGALHGVGLALDHLWRRFQGRGVLIPRAVRVVITFHVVALAWVFFRAPSLSVAVHVLSMLAAPFAPWPSFSAAYAFPVVLIAVFLATHPFDDHRRLRIAARRASPALFWSLVSVAWLLAFSVSQGGSDDFIYFDF